MISIIQYRDNNIMVKYVTSMDEFQTLLQQAGDKLVIVDFFADWCEPCNNIAPEFERLSEENPGVVFMYVDVDKCSDIAKAFKVAAMPTFKFIKLNTHYKTIIGANLPAIKRGIKRYSTAVEVCEKQEGISTSQCCVIS